MRFLYHEVNGDRGSEEERRGRQKQPAYLYDLPQA